MKVEDQYTDVLQNIETAIALVYRQHQAMTDYAALRALEAAVAHYKDQARGRIPRPVSLDEPDQTVFNHVSDMCEWRLGRKALDPGQGGAAPIEPIPLEAMVDCLRRLVKSVNFWNRQAGRQGYLDYISHFVG